MKGVALSTVAGVNYIPSTAHNSMAIWLDYDTDLVERELTFAQQAGVNTVRVFLHHLPWQHNALAFMLHFEHLLSACANRSIHVLPVLLDSCFGNITPNASWIATKAYRNHTWIPNPGPAIVSNRSAWTAIDSFVDAVVRTHADDARVLGWDVMNEPAFGTAGILDFVKHYVSLVKRLSPLHFTTVGVAFASQVPQVDQWIDVLSVHSYSPLAGLASDLGLVRARATKQGKQVILSECMDRGRSELCEDVLPVVRQPAHDGSATGFIVWELMLGVDQFDHPTREGPYQGLIEPQNGTWWSAKEKACFQRAAGPAPPFHVNRGNVRFVATTPTARIHAAQTHSQPL